MTKYEKLLYRHLKLVDALQKQGVKAHCDRDGQWQVNLPMLATRYSVGEICNTFRISCPTIGFNPDLVCERYSERVWLLKNSGEVTYEQDAPDKAPDWVRAKRQEWGVARGQHIELSYFRKDRISGSVQLLRTTTSDAGADCIKDSIPSAANMLTAHIKNALFAGEAFQRNWTFGVRIDGETAHAVIEGHEFKVEYGSELADLLREIYAAIVSAPAKA